MNDIQLLKKHSVIVWFNSSHYLCLVTWYSNQGTFVGLWLFFILLFVLKELLLLWLLTNRGLSFFIEQFLCLLVRWIACITLMLRCGFGIQCLVVLVNLDVVLNRLHLLLLIHVKCMVSGNWHASCSHRTIMYMNTLHIIDIDTSYSTSTH